MKDLSKLTQYRNKEEEKHYFPNGINSNTAGFFEIPLKTGRVAYVTADKREGWEHVAVATICSCPTWEEMCQIKDYFWEDEEIVIQYHPKKSEYVNKCKTCLHLWKPILSVIPTPPKHLLL